MTIQSEDDSGRLVAIHKPLRAAPSAFSRALEKPPGPMSWVLNALGAKALAILVDTRNPPLAMPERKKFRRFRIS